MSRSSFTVLPSEDQAEFDRLLESCRAEFTPENVSETFLVDQMAWSLWRVRRFQRFEAMAEENGNPKAAAAMRRLANSARKSHDLARRTLTASRKSSRRNKPQRTPGRPAGPPAGDTAYRV